MNYQIKEVADFILKCYACAGQSPSIQDVDALINLFCREVETSWRRHVRVSNKGEENERWNLNEIYYFIELGLSKVFGDYFGINLITFKQFEHAYSKQEYLQYRKAYLEKNPYPPQKELSQYTESHKEEVVKKSIVDKINDKSCKETDYAPWYDFLVGKKIIKENAWKKYIYNSEDDYDPAKDRLLIHLRTRKEVATNLRQFHLIDGIMKDIEDAEKDNPNIEDIKYWCKVLFFEDIINNETKKEYLIKELSK